MKSNFIHLITSILISICVLTAPYKITAKLFFESISKPDIKAIHKKFLTPESSFNLPLGDQIIQYLMETGRYDKLDLFKIGQDFLIKGVPIQIFKKISTKGNQLIHDNQVLSLGGISINHPYKEDDVRQAADNIREYYLKQGYFNSYIQAHVFLPNPFEAHLKYEIQEKSPCFIKDIFIQASPDLKTKILSRIKKYKGRTLTNKTLKKIYKTIQRILIKNSYLKAILIFEEPQYNKDKTKAKLTYTIDHPYKYKFIINGNNYYNRSSILKIFQVNKYREDIDPFNRMRLNLIEAYKKKGFAHIAISHHIVTKPKKFVKEVNFHINEGNRVRLSKIKVSSPLNKSDEYAKFIKSNSSKLVSSNYYNEMDLNNGWKNLISHLKNQGYLNAKHISTWVEYLNKKESLVTVHFTINEGSLTRIKEINFKGITSFPPKKLIDLIKLKTGEPLRFNELKKGMEEIKKFYVKNGFLEMQILNEDPESVTDPQKQLIQWKVANTQADLNFIVHEGPQIRVSSIDIQGNKFTKDSIILKEIDFSVGDILTKEKIESSQQSLYELEIFSSVNIYTFEQETNVSDRTIIIQVHESMPGTFKAGIGMTSERGLTNRLYVGASYNNIRGTTRAISGRLDHQTNLLERNQEDEIKFISGYLEPYLFNSMWHGRVLAIIERELRDEDQQTERYVNSQTLNLSLEKDLTKNISLNWALWNYTQRKLTVLPKSNSNTQRTVLNQLQIGQIGPSLILEYRDDPLSPQRGFYSKLSTLYATPKLGSSQSVNFLRFEWEFRHYIPLHRKWVWANFYSTGYINDLLGNNGKSGIPYSSFFFLGGQNSIRGFGGSDPLERIPNSDAIDLIDPNSQTQLLQAELIRTQEVFYHLIRSELRFPIKSPLEGVIFYDFGGVKMSDIPQTRTWRQSFGVGLRLSSPLGPISLDYARKVNPLTGIGPNGQRREREHQFHLSIGAF